MRRAPAYSREQRQPERRLATPPVCEERAYFPKLLANMKHLGGGIRGWYQRSWQVVQLFRFSGDFCSAPSSPLGSAKSAPHPFVFNALGTAFVPRGRGACNIGVRGLALLLGHAVRVGSVEERHGSRGLLGLQKNQKRPLKSPATSKKSFLTQMRLLLK